jgi:hypothetical protein
MKIEIVKEIDKNNHEVWAFNMFDLTAVFVTWYKKSKPEGKRKFIVTEFWDKYSRDQRMSEEPNLPDEIKKQVFTEVLKYIHVRTWKEFKGDN